MAGISRQNRQNIKIIHITPKVGLLIRQIDFIFHEDC
jgi:hypothetical protein